MPIAILNSQREVPSKQRELSSCGGLLRYALYEMSFLFFGFFCSTFDLLHSSYLCVTFFHIAFLLGAFLRDAFLRDAFLCYTYNPRHKSLYKKPFVLNFLQILTFTLHTFVLTQMCPSPSPMLSHAYFGALR